MIDFFINRPKFAIVIAIVMTLAGLMTIVNMPVSLYPSVAPPTIKVTAFFPGADHNTIRDTVATVIEQQVNGVEDMIYIDSKSSNDGSYIAKVTFEIGTDPDEAQTLVQNRVNKAMSKLPGIVKQLGVTVAKVSPDLLLTLNVYSPNGTYDDLFISNFVSINIKDPLLRIRGLGELNIIGEKNYSVRVWLDNEKLSALKVNPSEVSAAIASQNTTVAAGKLGESPSVDEQVFQYAIQTRGRLKELEDFENVIVRADSFGGLIRVKDVARVELGAESYSSSSRYKSYSSPLVMGYLSPGANSIEVATAIKKELKELEKGFPDDLEYAISFDSTEFTLASMDEVYKTFFEALFLVGVITFLFLQNWRATLIPLIAIPVSLIATFVVMQSFGMDINTISMFGLILAIGIVVDAAIVVIENVERIMHEEHIDAKPATSKAMKEVTAPLVASALVLMAVFVPVSLAPGMVGILYQQFGVAIVASTIISTIVALILTPALCAAMMKVEPLKETGILGFVNRIINGMNKGYGGIVGFLGKRFFLTISIFIAVLCYTGYLGNNMSSGFLPVEDKGTFLVDVTLPEATTLARTQKVVEKVTADIEAIPGVKATASGSGFSILKGALSTNSALIIVTLDTWSERQTPELSLNAIVAQAQGAMSQYKELRSLPLTMPAIPGLGATSGISLILEDTLGRSTESIGPVYQQFAQELMAQPEIMVAMSTFTANVPQMKLDIDYEKAFKQGVRPEAVNQVVGISFGKQYVNDYTKFGKNFQVNVMSDAQYRNDETDLETLYVKATTGDMVPFSSFAKFEPIVGADISARYNLFNATQLLIVQNPAFGSGDVIKKIEEVAANLPEGYKTEWTALTYQEVKTSGGMVALFAIALLFTFLFLVAQYESWMTPFAIILCVPTALLGAMVYVSAAGGTLNLYVQIGLVLMIGMACRNAILIVEFAKVLREEKGLSVLEAGVQAAKLRMRAVLMTALAFILGVIPLVLASGAGAASRNAMGQSVFGGMLSATFVGCIFVPIFFMMMQKLRERCGSKTEVARLADEQQTEK
ncbi:efflux RND transporter permease subunit [Thalassotalea sp. PLHSN55]|uniref:efflux RND transporter permease subunit n=1 Tax=Thalassotalea sp. PLHSN55 TaxID=3435888 RepID=UPI003F86B350